MAKARQQLEEIKAAAEHAERARCAALASRAQAQPSARERLSLSGATLQLCIACVRAANVAIAETLGRIL
jgi:hypothetical protein